METFIKGFEGQTTGKFIGEFKGIFINVLKVKYTWKSIDDV